MMKHHWAIVKGQKGQCTMWMHLVPEQHNVSLRLFGVIRAAEMVPDPLARVRKERLGDEGDGRHSALYVQHDGLWLLGRCCQLDLLAHMLSVCGMTGPVFK